MAPPKRPPEGLYAEALTASAKSLDALRRLTALPESPELHEVEADAARFRGAFSESVAALLKAVALRPGDRRLEKNTGAVSVAQPQFRGGSAAAAQVRHG